MKNLFRLFGFLVIALTFSCNSNDDDGVQRQEQPRPLQNFQSSFCPGITGPMGAYWDFGHGRLLPLNEVPVIKNPGQQFIHSRYPYLGLILPVGFTAQEINDPTTQAIGVNILRNDGLVLWKYIPSMTILGNVNAKNIVADEVNATFQNFNFNGDFNLLCTSSNTKTENGFLVQSEARLIQFGNMTTQIGIQVLGSPSTGASFITIYKVFAPTAAYNSQVMETFLPFTYQLFVNPDNTLSDRDNDGTPDIYDSAPDDPTRR